ncbi:unnamed protein product, partial [Tenebrio molitor]
KNSGRSRQWKIEDDLIYKYIPARIPFEANVREWILYVPAEQRQQVLLECDDHPTASHFGIFKTLIFGVPQFILCDNGTQFAGRALRDLAAKYRVQSIWFNARYHPQVNFVERTHRSVGTAIKSYVQSHDTWDGEIQKIQQAINTARHEITGYTPAFLNFGRHVPLSGNYYGTV